MFYVRVLRVLRPAVAIALGADRGCAKTRDDGGAVKGSAFLMHRSLGIWDGGVKLAVLPALPRRILRAAASMSSPGLIGCVPNKCPCRSVTFTMPSSTQA